MGKKLVVWTETAVRQRREILRYWTIRNGSTKYANKLIRLTRERINLILDNPKAFKLTTYMETRESAMGHFSLYYKLQDERLIIMAFWDNRQDPKKLLEVLTR